jgi:CPA1 family monovalent cation:H+ antiporter
MEQFETIARIKEQLVRSTKATEGTNNESDKKQALHTVRALYRRIMLEIVTLRREGLNRFRLEKRFDDEVIRIMENNLDLEEARLNKV